MSDEYKSKDAGPDEHRKLSREDDTEGHRKLTDDGEEPGPDEGKKMPLRDDDSVEGHRK